MGGASWVPAGQFTHVGGRVQQLSIKELHYCIGEQSSLLWFKLTTTRNMQADDEYTRFLSIEHMARVVLVLTCRITDHNLMLSILTGTIPAVSGSMSYLVFFPAAWFPSTKIFKAGSSGYCIRHLLNT